VLADGRADGERCDLVAFSVRSSAAELRDCLLALYRLRDVGSELREKMSVDGEPLQDRLIMACICQEVEEAIRAARAWLSRRARRGSAAGASMAQGCAAPLPAAGAAPGICQGGAGVLPDSPVFSGPERQELPVGESVGHTQTQQEASLHG
jgi:hypothetical protein